MEALENWFATLHIALNFVFFGVGGLLIWKGADWLMESAVAIARGLRVPKVVIGATIVSILTTLPEFAVSFSAALMGHVQMTIGNALGSVACNTGLVLGTTLLFRQIATDRRVLVGQCSFLMGAALLFTGLTLGGTLHRWGAGALIVLLAAYVYYSVSTARRSRAAQETDAGGAGSGESMGKEIGVLFIGGALVAAGSILLVQNGVLIARWLGVPELIIALTIVALGTSLPEYVVAIAGLVKGHPDVSVGNIIGANLLDIVWVLGVSGLVAPLTLARQTRVLDVPFVLALLTLLVIFSLTGRRLRRVEGGVLVAVYIVYLALMFVFFAGAGG